MPNSYVPIGDGADTSNSICGCAWWHPLTNLEKKLLILIACLSFIIFALSLAVAIKDQKDVPSNITTIAPPITTVTAPTTSSPTTTPATTATTTPKTPSPTTVISTVPVTSTVPVSTTDEPTTASANATTNDPETTTQSKPTHTP